VSTERTLEQLHVWMGESVSRVHRAVRNMREVSPGFPEKTPGNGDPPGGSGGVSTTLAERMAVAGRSITNDDALADRARLDDLTRQMRPLISEARDIVLRWGYTTAGEFDPSQQRRPGRPTEGESNRDRWCRSCERLEKAEPIGDKGRRGLCRWCADFEDAEKMLPPLALLDMRHRGERITTAAVARLKREGQITKPARPARKKRRR
jgi:hypothetical protein